MRIRIAAIAVLVLFLSLGAITESRAHHFEASAPAGELRFWGDGTCIVEGRGTLFIRNLNNLRVEIEAEYGEVETITDGNIYHHFEGTMTVRGKGGHVEIRGWDLKMSVTGKGKAWVRGEVGNWTLDGEGGGFPPKKKWKKIYFRDWK